MSLSTSHHSCAHSGEAREFPPESLDRLIQAILECAGPVPGWPIGRLSLQEREAACCLGIEFHVLRDARLRLGLPHSRIGRTVVYTAEQLLSVLHRQSNGTAELQSQAREASPGF